MFDKFKKVKNMVYNLLGAVNLEKLFDYSDGYYLNVVKEFYASLCEEVFEPTSIIFEKARRA